jgi:hypothetical protein
MSATAAVAVAGADDADRLQSPPFFFLTAAHPAAVSVLKSNSLV